MPPTRWTTAGRSTARGRCSRTTASRCARAAASRSRRPASTRTGDRFDYVVILAGLLQSPAPVPDELYEYILDVRRRDVPLVGLCAGQFRLAELGLLDGRKCAVHFIHEVAVKRLFPGVIPITTEPVVRDGPYMTCPGGFATLHPRQVAGHRALRGVALAQGAPLLAHRRRDARRSGKPRGCRRPRHGLQRQSGPKGRRPHAPGEHRERVRDGPRATGRHHQAGADAPLQPAPRACRRPNTGARSASTPRVG